MTDMLLHVSTIRDTPNVVRLNIPSDHREDGAAWIYVPSKDVIYIGPPGSYGVGGTVDLAATVKSLVDSPKGEKFISGVMYNDGYSDYFQATNDEEEDRIMAALQDYHEAYYTSNGAFRGQGYDEGFRNYPIEDDTAYDPEDDLGEGEPIYDSETGELLGYLRDDDSFVDKDDINKPTLDEIPDDSAWAWLRDRNWSGSGDYSVMKPTPGTSKPIREWTKEDHLAWRDEADDKRGKAGYGWAAREDLNHFRWSFGDDNLVKGAPHQGLWLWPTESGYPDHFSQTGSAGLGNCAQGRVYPHFNNKWEILTWPDRPRNIKDKHIKSAIQAEAQAAVKQYLIDRIGVKPEDIFFTAMHYGDAVSNYDSPAYPAGGWSGKSGPGRYTPGLDPKPMRGSEDYNWDTERGVYDAYGRSPMDTNQLTFDDDGNANFTQKNPSFFENRPGDTSKLLNRVVDKIKGNPSKGDEFTDGAGITWKYDRFHKKYFPVNDDSMTPEDRWTEAVKRHDETVKSLGGGIVPQEGVSNSQKTWSDHNGVVWVRTPDRGWIRQSELQVPEGNSQFSVAPNEVFKVHKSDGHVISVSQEDYQKAVEEYGEDNWWYKFLGPRDTITDITKDAASIHDYDPEEEMRQGFLDSLNNGEQPTGQSYYKQNGPVKQEAFCWLGVGYGQDEGKGDPKDAELVTGTAHWNIVNKLIGSKLQTINEFLYHTEQGNFEVPMVWGWIIQHPMMKGVYVKFLTHLMENKQDLEYIPQVLAAISKMYKQPIEGYDVEESNTPIMERFPVSGGGAPTGAPPDPGLATAPIPLGTEQQSKGPVELPQGARVLDLDTVGFVTITTYSLGKGELYETEVSGGEMDGHVFPSYSESEARRMHDLLVRDEEAYQRTSAIMKKSQEEGFNLDAFVPTWHFWFAYSPTQLKYAPANTLIAYSPDQLQNSIKIQNLDESDMIIGQVGKIGAIPVFKINSGEEDNKLVSALKITFGVDPLPFDKVEESLKSGEIPSFMMPQHGCFGYVNGHLIIGQRHHQEIMFRLLENGWTWEDLLNAPQVWGWFSKNLNNNYNVWFSSDAGLMTGDDLKQQVILKLSQMTGAPVTETGGYGGKSKEEFGGNFDKKYGDPLTQNPEDMEGHKTKQKSTILSPIPPPPSQEDPSTEQEPAPTTPNATEQALNALLPGGGTPPPKKVGTFAGVPVMSSEDVPPNTLIAIAKRKKHKGVRYHGLHHPHVLQHVWRYHDWFENCVPHVDDHDGDDNDTPAPAPDPAPTSSPADNPATI